MIQINVSQLLKSPIGTIKDYEIGDIVDTADGSWPVVGDIRLMRTDRSILAKGTLHTELERTCSRCLCSFSCPLTLDIEEEYFPTIDVTTGAALPLPDEPGSFIISENNVLDLTEAIRQYVLTATPIKPLCSEDCAGLCPTCGVNLNQASCKCPPKPVDPRWAGLTKYILADKESKN